jgi:hypothetical protein
LELKFEFARELSEITLWLAMPGVTELSLKVLSPQAERITASASFLLLVQWKRGLQCVEDYYFIDGQDVRRDKDTNMHGLC